MQLVAELNNTVTAKKILKALPFENTVKKLGKEIIIDTPHNLPPEKATTDVQTGDVTYWPTGN
ncbi:MAG: cyclophilin-like fold protein [Elusimicrobiota bacterium]